MATEVENTNGHTLEETDKTQSNDITSTEGSEKPQQMDVSSPEKPHQVVVSSPEKHNDASVEKSEKAEKDKSAKILEQIEYYFGDFNLLRDKFLKSETEKDDGWVTLNTLVSFRRLANLSKEHSVILDALKSSKLIEIHESSEKIRRSKDHPLPKVEGDIMEETRSRTVYCKGFPKDGSIKLDNLLEYFREQHGQVDNIYMRRFQDKITKKEGFKGSILVVFPTKEKAQEFLDLESVQFNKNPLLRLWHADYLKEKTEEYEERKKQKNERNQRKESDKELIAASMPKGTYLYLTKLPESLSREDIRAAVLEVTKDLAYVGFNKGDEGAYIRLKTENSNAKVLEEAKGKLKINDKEIEIRIVEGDEENEQLRKANEARHHSMSNPRGNKRKFRGRGGPPNKRSRR